MEFSKFLSSNKIVSRQYALEHNLPRYFTGKPCINGHIAERYTKKTRCVDCDRIKKQKARDKRKKLLGANGQNTYSTGKPCIHGHLAERYVVSNTCVECKRIQKEKEKIKARPLREKQKKLRKEAAEKKKDAAEKKKKERQQKFQESKLNKKEKEIVDYARKCLRQMYQKPSKYRMRSYMLPENIIELENGYSTYELNDYLYRLRPSWRTKRKWHVDHIIPLSRLVKKGVTEVYILNSLDNLQLLTPAANMKKSAKLVMSEDEVDEFIANKLRGKWASKGYTEPLGLYNPSERIKKLVNSEAERIYKVVTSSISRTNFRIKSSKNVALKAIKDDMWGGYYFFSENSSFSEKEIYDEFARKNGSISESSLMHLLYEGYQPLKKYISESKKHSDFKYREDGQKYFERQKRSCNDAVAKVYFHQQIILSGSLKEKGLFRRLF